MEIRRKRTHEGYTLHLVCDECHREVEVLDPQKPLWHAVLRLDEHKVIKHRSRQLSTSDDAVGRAYYRYPDREIETLQLPELCPGCGEDAAEGSHGQGNGYGGCV